MLKFLLKVADLTCMIRIVLILSLLFSFSAQAEKKAICSLYYAKEVRKIVESSGHFDKFKHCGVSCLLTLRCPSVDVLQIGIFKELADIVGPGNAEWLDLEADYKGVRLVTSKKAKNDQECLSQCHQIYPEGSCR